MAETPSSPVLPGRALDPFHLAPPLRVSERNLHQARSWALSTCAALCGIKLARSGFKDDDTRSKITLENPAAVAQEGP